MTGGGFYVVSFVSRSSCFMLKPSGHYVIKLLGVWRAQAPASLAFCTMATSSQLGPATRLGAKGLWCQEGGAILAIVSWEATSVYDEV